MSHIVIGGLGFVLKPRSTKGEILGVTFNRKIYKVMTQSCWVGKVILYDMYIHLLCS